MRVVGIHHRRGDHLDYERVYRIPHITMAYLGPSMDLYLEKYNNSVLFLYVSDDREWGEKYFARDRNVVLSLSDSTQPAQATGEDLALLALCDDMITTRQGLFILISHRVTLGGIFWKMSLRENKEPWQGNILPVGSQAGRRNTPETLHVPSDLN